MNDNWHESTEESAGLRTLWRWKTKDVIRCSRISLDVWGAWRVHEGTNHERLSSFQPLVLSSWEYWPPAPTPAQLMYPNVMQNFMLPSTFFLIPETQVSAIKKLCRLLKVYTMWHYITIPRCNKIGQLPAPFLHQCHLRTAGSHVIQCMICAIPMATALETMREMI
jgi:hypothetical protein